MIKVGTILLDVVIGLSVVVDVVMKVVGTVLLVVGINFSVVVAIVDVVVGLDVVKRIFGL